MKNPFKLLTSPVADQMYRLVAMMKLCAFHMGGSSGKC